MQHYHAVVWLDHREAHVYFFNRDSFDEVDIQSSKAKDRLQHIGGRMSGRRTPEDHAYLHKIVETLKPAQEWLIMGPGTAKVELVKHIHKHDHELSERIIGVETSDHPTDRQIVAHARDFFKSADRMRPQV